MKDAERIAKAFAMLSVAITETEKLEDQEEKEMETFRNIGLAVSTVFMYLYTIGIEED
jgi:hypothetical protein